MPAMTMKMTGTRCSSPAIAIPLAEPNHPATEKIHAARHAAARAPLAPENQPGTATSIAEYSDTPSG